MTRAAIVETLSKDFGADAEVVRGVLEMLDAGLSATYVGRFRRGDSRLTETLVRRLARRREELEELDRRRGTILRMLSGLGEDGGDDPTTFPEIRACMDRFELEDLFLPHRRPEPEVQLALDRGLGGLADRLVAPSPRAQRPARAEAPAAAEAAAEISAIDADHDHAAEAFDASEASDAPAASDAPEATDALEASDAPEASDATEPSEAPDAPDASDALEPSDAPAEPALSKTAEDGARAPQPTHVAAELPGLREAVEVTPALARLCAEYVNPDRGVHTEEEALAGAMRILSDRLGRDPGLRRAVRKALRKHGVLVVRASGDESRTQRHKALLKTREPVRQLQSKKLLRLRQAQKDRAITTSIQLDPAAILPRVRKALGQDFDPDLLPVIDAVCAQALVRRLLPMIEADVRLELKERADDEALRFLSQHLRQLLLSPVAGRRPVAGMVVSARADWILVPLDEDGNPVAAEVKIETRDKDDRAVAEELASGLRGTGVRAIAVGSGKGSLAQVARLRECIRILDADAAVFVVNEAGLSNYANSDLARKEFPDHNVPARMAISLGRRYQDLLLELLKVDPRHLGLGMEAGLVSKANLRRTLDETVESAVALVGCDVNTAPLAFLRRVPGLDDEAAKRIVERRAQAPFGSREELRASGVLSEAQWVSAIAFLRVPDSSEPLDRTSLHPDEYADARRLIESTGGSVDEVLGARGATKGLRRADFGIDETTWRDLVREIAFPGRDPRLRLFPADLLPPDTDPATLEPGRVVEGIVTNLTSFGAFVDLGIAREGLVHVSETSNRYVRDAREVLSIGQVVRARVLDASGQRVMLSLKNVPAFERKRPARPPRRRDREGDAAPQRWSEPDRTVRAAQTRRDGLAGAAERRGRKGGGGGGGGGGGRKQGAAAGVGGGSRGGYGASGGGGRRPGGRGREEDYDAEAVRRAQSTSVRYNPFAAFFDKGREGEGADAGASQETTEATEATE